MQYLLNITPLLKWSIVKQVKNYTNNSANCPFSLQKKYEILFYTDKNELLNKRSELITKCRHMNKFLLALTTNPKTDNRSTIVHFSFYFTTLSPYHVP